MTPGEVVRFINSRSRVRHIEAQERASYDYILANLIVKGIGITLGSKEEMPAINTIYPDLFKDVIKEHEEKIQEQKAQLSALRFKQFAQSYNKHYKKQEVVETDE
jgi:hypothetical protein